MENRKNYDSLQMNNGVFMKAKNSFIVTIVMMLNCCALVAMDQALRPIDRVFLNACKNNKSIDFAIKQGANIKVVDPETGYTGLHYVCKNENWEHVSRLIDENITVLFIVSEDGYDHIAAIRGSKYGDLDEIVQRCVNNRLVFACDTRIGPLDSFQKEVRRALKLGAHINFEDNNGYTPLFYLCMFDDKDKIAKAKFLLENGADINHLSNKLKATLIYTLLATVNLSKKDFEYSEMINFLIKNKADVNILGPDNHSVLQAAIILRV